MNDTERIEPPSIELPRSDLIRAIRGAAEVVDEAGVLTPLRLPRWVRAQQSDSIIETMASTSAGVRIVLEGSASAVELELDIERLPRDNQEPWPASIVAMVGGVVVDTVSVDDAIGARVILDLSGETARGLDGRIEIWLPHTARVGLRRVWSNGPLSVPNQEADRRWLHHGSSISHSLEADGPVTRWTAQVARAQNLSLTDMGFAGEALLDPFVARVIAATKADVITLKLGINIVNCGGMIPRTFGPALHGFLDIIREGHPHTPVVVISPIVCPPHEHNPGPTLVGSSGFYGRSPDPDEDALNLVRVREIIADVVRTRAVSDGHLSYLDGRELLGVDPGDAALLPDLLHPDQAGMNLMAARFSVILGELLSGASDATTPTDS
jgi:lysophospholipase L1-like esterase